jgi:hypothetical protein
MTAPGRRRIPPDDLGHALGLFSVATWLLYALFVVEVGYLALVLGGAPAHTALGIGALVVVLAAGLLIVLPGATPLPVWRTATIVAVIVLVTVAITWQTPFHDHNPRYVSWELNPCDLLMFCLAIRGRILAAWIGQAMMLATIAVWSVSVTGSPLFGLSFSYTQPFPLLAVTIFAVGLHRTARQIVAHRGAEHERAAREEREAASDLGMASELRIVRELATPTLTRIAAYAGPPPASVRSLEAALRDLIRWRNLAVEPLTTTLRQVRERGADVVLLDDLGDDDVTEAERHAVARWAADHVAAASGSALTLRITREAGAPLATLTVDGEPAAELRLPAGPAAP